MEFVKKDCGSEISAVFQVGWYSNVPSDYCPSFPTVSGQHILYEYVHGGLPLTVEEVIARAEIGLWAGTPIAQPDIPKYCDYVWEVAAQLNIMSRRLSSILTELPNHAVTPVRLCHGDMTMENVVLCNKSHKIKFIDPGVPRGLACRENDEAKLLQSAYGWEASKGGPSWQLDGFKPRRVHKMILATHYVRLLRHRHPPEAIAHAQEKLDTLLKELRP